MNASAPNPGWPGRGTLRPLAVLHVDGLPFRKNTPGPYPSRPWKVPLGPRLREGNPNDHPEGPIATQDVDDQHVMALNGPGSCGMTVTLAWSQVDGLPCMRYGPCSSLKEGWS